MRLTFCLILLIQTSLTAQSVQAKFEHNALLVKDVALSAEFYSEVLGLKPIPVPDANEERRWFAMGEGLQLHLIEGDNSEVRSHKSIHLAFRVEEIEPLVELLESRSVDYYSWPGKKGVVTTRADGIHQIYIQDPDGYWIEINDM